MNKRQLAVAVTAILALSSSTIASAEGGSHRRIGGYDRLDSVAPIGLASTGGVLTIDTSTATPSFAFDTTTAFPHIDFDTTTATTQFDDEPGISDDAADDVLPAGTGNSTASSEESNSPIIPSAGTNVPGVPVPPSAPSWITKPHAKSNDENNSQSGATSQSSGETDD